MMVRTQKLSSRIPHFANRVALLAKILVGIGYLPLKCFHVMSDDVMLASITFPQHSEYLLSVWLLCVLWCCLPLSLFLSLSLSRSVSLCLPVCLSVLNLNLSLLRLRSPMHKSWNTVHVRPHAGHELWAMDALWWEMTEANASFSQGLEGNTTYWDREGKRGKEGDREG